MKKAMGKNILACLLVLAMILQIGIGLPIIYAKTITSVGDFTVTGGNLGTDYVYGNNTLTVQTNTPLTIQGTTKRDSIEVTEGIEANITLQDTSIDVSSNDAAGAFVMLGNARCNLTIEGTNSLTGGDYGASLQVETRNGKTASIVIDGTGTLIANGTYYGSGIGGAYTIDSGTITINGGTIHAINSQGTGIGGGYDASGGVTTINGGTIIASSSRLGAGIGGGYRGNGGIITINGGTVIATGNIGGACIGGGYGSYGGGNGGNITINGGTVVANNSSGGNGIGNGDEGTTGTFSTSVTGNAFIVTNSISDESNKANWKGVIFNGNDGTVYGDAIALTTSAEIPAGHNLAIANGKTLTVAKGITLQNKGTTTNLGTINNQGRIISEGIYEGTHGIFIGNPIINVVSSSTSVAINPSTVDYGKDTTITATIAPTSTADVKGNVDFYLGDESSGIKLNKDPIVVDQDTQTATFNITNAIWETSGAVWNIGNNTITAVYHGTVDLKKSHGNGILTVNKASQTAPELTSTAETISGKADGKINGLTTTMEYSSTKVSPYTAVTDVNMNFANGTYYVRYQGDSNHEPSDSIKVTINKGKMLKVSLPVVQEGYTLTADKTEMNWQDHVKLTFTLKAGYSKAAEFALKVNGTPVTLSEDGTYTITDNEDDPTVTVEGVKDSTVPTGSIQVQDNTWNTHLNNITFGFFFKDTQSVSITGEDTGSGIVNIEYYVADRKVDDLADIVWTKGTTFSLNPNKKAVIYARITDKAGNTTIINSEGLVFYSDSTIEPQTVKIDTDMPEDVQVTLTLHDNTLKEIKNGTNILKADQDYTMNGNQVMIKKAYLATISKHPGNALTFVFNPMGIKTDMTINTATLTITAKAAITPKVTIANRKYGEAPTKPVVSGNPEKGIETVLYKVKNADDCTYSKTVPTDVGEYTVKVEIAQTDNYRHGSATADFSITKASQAAPKITSTAETISGKADGKINGLTMMMEYSDTLASTYTAVTAMNMNFANGTYYVRYQADTNHEQSDSIKITINKGKILHVMLPTNQEGYIVTVDKTEMNWNDEVTLTYMLKEGYQETADFSIMINGKPIRLDHGKYVFSKNEKDTIITVRGIENMYTYGILNGENSEWIENSREGLTFRIDGDFTKLKDIRIDEKFVDSKYYEVKEGSTIITLKPEYLKMLSTGKHTMVVGYTDHEVPVNFTIRKVKSTTATGDESARMNWILLLLASSAIIVFVVIQQVIKRRK